MKFLVDTHFLLWLTVAPKRLSETALTILNYNTNILMFSTVSIWEVAIKFGLGRNDFTLPPKELHDALLENQFEELAITSEQTYRVSDLPAVHRDPFDRLLIAQAMTENVILLTSNPVMARYPGPIRLIA